MGGYFDIMKQSIPEWYGLDIRESDGTLLIPVHESVADYIENGLSPQTPTVRWLQEHSGLGLPIFISPKQQEWGFGSSVSWEDSNETDCRVINCKLPIILSGKGQEPSFEKALALSATLQILFTALTVAPLEEIHSLHSQLLVVYGFTTKSGPRGGSFSIMLSKNLVGWISSQKDYSQNQELIATMKTASKYMWRDDADESHELKALFSQPKWVKLSCFGNGCVLGPEDYDDKREGIGYKLFPHNIDSPFQQLVLLCAVAKMYQLARRAGY